MRALVTGATGFVGPHLTALLVGEGDEVVATAHDADEPERGELDVRALDVTRADACRRLVADVAPDVVYHLAAVSHVQAPVEMLYHVNAVGSANLFAAVAAEAPDARVLAVSSAQVYGNVPAAQTPIAETAPVHPTTHYGASKAAMELAARVHAHAGLHVVVARAFNHTGPGQPADFVVPTIAKQLAAIAKGKAEAVVRLGALAPVRDFLDVRDVVRAYRALALDAPPGSVVNVASGEGVSIGELARRMAALAGLEVEVVSKADRVREAELDTSVGDATLLAKLTGWSRRYTLDQTLRAVLDEAMA